MSILFERIDALAKEKQLSFREIEVSAGLANIALEDGIIAYLARIS